MEKQKKAEADLAASKAKPRFGLDPIAKMNQAKSASLSPPVIADQKSQDRQQILTKETGAHNPPLGSDQTVYSYQAQDRQQQPHSAEKENNAATNQTFNMDMSHSKQHAAHEILSPEVLDENASLARTLVYKSSETSGLVDLYDRMYQENPLEADVNFQNLVQQTRALDEKVGQTLLDELSVTRNKYRVQIIQAKANYRTGQKILGQLRSGDYRQAQQAMQRMQE